jgi:hypothetical protein
MAEQPLCLRRAWVLPVRDNAADVQNSIQA